MPYRSFLNCKNSLVLIIALLFYFAFWWFYKLDVLPGLHGDEAWVGLKAHDYQTKTIDRFSGMTYYTGILQTLLVQLSFNLFGLGVYQLRLPSAFVNLASLVIIVSTFFTYKLYKEAITFLLILAASSLYIISARIAWEVNTFTLFFLAITFSSLMAIHRSPKRANGLWISLFWLTNIIGSYNHIIYSSISVAGFGGLLFWAIQRDVAVNVKLLALFGVNFFNVVCVFLVMRYDLNFFVLHPHCLPFSLLLLVVLELIFHRLLSDVGIKIGFVSPALKYFVLIILCFAFIYNQGRGLFDVLSQHKLILEVYSYECSLIFEIFFDIGATCFACVVIFFLFNDLKGKGSENTIFAYVIMCYLPLLWLYTNNSSLRYYLVIYAVLSFYLTFKLWQNSQVRKLFVSSQIVMLIFINAVLLDIFIYDPIPIKAIDFKIGNSQVETSADFLPKKPVIDFLKNNHISKINYLCYPYFIEQPIKFYKLISPWSELEENTAIIDYDYLKYKNGFILLKSR